MQARSLRFAFVAAPLALGLGCSLIATGDLANDAPEDAGVGAPQDASFADVEAALPVSDLGDGGDAASTGDEGGGNGAIGPSDAGADAEGGTFCQRQPAHTICSDFDGVNLAAGWTEDVEGNALFDLDTQNSVSPPNSLRASLNLDGGTGAAVAHLIELASCNVTHIHEEFDMLLETTGTPAAEQAITEFTAITQGEQTAGFEIALRPDGPVLIGNVLVDGGVGATSSAPLPSLAGGWKHIAFDIVLGDATNGHVSVAVDGTPEALLSVTTESEGCAEIGQTIGPDTDIYNGVPAGPMVIDYDNVTLDVTQ